MVPVWIDEYEFNVDSGMTEMQGSPKIFQACHSPGSIQLRCKGLHLNMLLIQSALQPLYLFCTGLLLCVGRTASTLKILYA